MIGCSPIYGKIKWDAATHSPVVGHGRSGNPPPLTKKEERAKRRWYEQREYQRTKSSAVSE